MRSKQRGHFTAEQKLAIVKRHLVDKVLCRPSRRPAWVRVIKRGDDTVGMNDDPQFTELLDHCVRGDEFVRGFLQHTFPRSFQRLRYYGFASPNSKLSMGWVRMLVLLFTGCDTYSSGLPPASSKAHVSEKTWLQYRKDLIETAALVAQYVQHWEKSGTWPKPGTYDTNVLIYKGTESGNPAFPNRRRDFYRTRFDGGRELDVILYDDGRIDVDVLWDREPVAPGR